MNSFAKIIRLFLFIWNITRKEKMELSIELFKIWHFRKKNLNHFGKKN